MRVSADPNSIYGDRRYLWRVYFNGERLAFCLEADDGGWVRVLVHPDTAQPIYFKDDAPIPRLVELANRPDAACEHSLFGEVVLAPCWPMS